MKEWWQKFLKKFTGNDPKQRWLFWIGLAGVLLIALTELFPDSSTALEETQVITVTEQQIEQALEQRITDLLCAVEGVGRCRVMVTLESGTQTVYAADTHFTAAGEEQTTVLRVETEAGLIGLKLTEIQPTVKGVAVVCDGGGNSTVCQRVIDVVTTAFHISERRVCVVKQN